MIIAPDKYQLGRTYRMPMLAKSSAVQQPTKTACGQSSDSISVLHLVRVNDLHMPTASAKAELLNPRSSRMFIRAALPVIVSVQYQWTFVGSDVDRTQGASV